MSTTNALIAALRTASLLKGADTPRVISEDEVEVRHLGEWEMPEGEEDDGDYDWEVPTDATWASVRKIADKLGWDVATGEKNWMTFTRKAKVTKAAQPASSGKYDYPAGMSAADKRKFRAAARRAKKS